MPTTCLFGAQWGDEGKGKVIDALAEEADVVVRFQGGANAGHTVVANGRTWVLHLIPSGILHPGKVNVIGSGLAVDPQKLLDEIEELRAGGVVVDEHNLRVSARAHAIFPHHRRLDAASERWRGDGRIGTTGRGIGPCYADKAARTGLRLADLCDANVCRPRLHAALAEKNALLVGVHGEEPLDEQAEVERALVLGQRLAPFLADTGCELRQAAARGDTILFEGAQGILLDIDHGTYPFVTSSSTGPSGVGSGAPFPPSRLDRSLGIAKAYCTRVGEGPFPTELGGSPGERLRAAGGEFGATTGRPRRCGWFDALAVRYALELAGASGLVLTKLDVLSGLDEVPLAVGYRAGAGELHEYPAARARIDDLEPIYETLPGWSADLSGVRRFEDLPPAAQTYVARIEECVGCPVEMVSVGPAREQIVRAPSAAEVPR